MRSPSKLFAAVLGVAAASLLCCTAASAQVVLTERTAPMAGEQAEGM